MIMQASGTALVANLPESGKSGWLDGIALLGCKLVHICPICTSFPRANEANDGKLSGGEWQVQQTSKLSLIRPNLQPGGFLMGHAATLFAGGQDGAGDNADEAGEVAGGDSDVDNLVKDFETLVSTWTWGDFLMLTAALLDSRRA